MTTDPLDGVRGSVLDRMERADRVVRFAILAGGVAEAGLFAVAFLLVDWSSRVERLLFLFSLLSYSILVFGLIALAGHVTRVGGRILSAIAPTVVSERS